MHNFKAINLKEALAMEPNKVFVSYNPVTGRLDKLSFQGRSSTCKAQPLEAATHLVGDADQTQVDNTFELATVDHIELHSAETRQS